MDANLACVLLAIAFFMAIAAVAALVQYSARRREARRAEVQKQLVWRSGINLLNRTGDEQAATEHQVKLLLQDLQDKTSVLDKAHIILADLTQKDSRDMFYNFAEVHYIRSQAEQESVLEALVEKIEKLVRIRKRLESFTFHLTPDHLQADAKRTIARFIRAENEATSAKDALLHYQPLPPLAVTASMDAETIIWRTHRSQVRLEARAHHQTKAKQRFADERDGDRLLAALSYPDYAH